MLKWEGKKDIVIARLAPNHEKEEVQFLLSISRYMVDRRATSSRKKGLKFCLRMEDLKVSAKISRGERTLFLQRECTV